MSRIHEALKKAAEERNSLAGNDHSIGRPEISVDQFQTAPVLENRKTAARRGPAKEVDNAGFLQFQNYAKSWVSTDWKMDPNGSVFCKGSLIPFGAERYRTLRSRLYQISAVQPLRRILVTSSLPAEGKTFTVANLGQSFVRQPNRSALLIDGDLRAARLHVSFGAPCTPGLSDYLKGDAELHQIIQVGSEGTLCMIPAGSKISNPGELLHSDRMKHLLDYVSNIFDWVILDSPPALAVHDASILADMCDGVLFVVRSGSTDAALAERAVSEFREKNLIGVVLNCVEKNDSYGGYYYGYGSDAPDENVSNN
jgi:protein-tyrosine kinase